MEASMIVAKNANSGLQSPVTTVANSGNRYHNLCRMRTASAADDPEAHKLLTADPGLGVLSSTEQTALLTCARIRVFGRREVIAREDDPVQHVVFVLSGFIKLSRFLSDGSELILDILGAGESIGGVRALQGRPYDMQISALSHCRLVLIERQAFRQACQRRPDALLAILNMAEDRLQRITEQLIDCRALCAAARLAKLLLRLTHMQAPGPTGAAEFPLQLTQEELGAMSGMRREHVSRHLCEWREAGWVQMQNGAVTRIQADAFAQICQTV
jgi:CRP/FNR family transcriptional regulator, cyclic AMP receptor protein